MPLNTEQRNNFSPSRMQYVYAFILLPIICLLSLLLVEQATAQIVLPPTIQANGTGKTSVYVDETNGLRMEYPSNWTKIQSSESVFFIAPPQEESGWDVGRLTLGIEDANLTLNEFASSYVSLYELVLDDFKVATSSETDMKGHPAHMLTFTSTSSNSSSKNSILVLVSLEDNKYATLLYESPSDLYSRYLPVVQRMIDSFEILPTSSPLQTPSISNETNSLDFSTLEDPYHGVKIEFPSDWTYRLLNTNVAGSSVKHVVAFYSQTPGLDRSDKLVFVVGVDELGSSEIPLEEYVSSKTYQIRQSNNITQEQMTTMSDKPSYQVIYTGGNVTAMELWTIEEDNAYVITVLSEPLVFNNYLPVVQRMIDSFEILPTSSPLQTPSISNETESISFIPYENTTNGIKIDYPSGWETTESSTKPTSMSMCHLFIQCTAHSVAFTSPQEGFSDRIRENVRVMAGFFARDMDLDEVVELFTGDLDETLRDYVPIRSDQISLRDNASAYMTAYQYSHPRFGVTNVMDVFTLKGQTAYLIKALIEPTKYSHYLPVVQRMIDSFEILPTSSPLQTPSISNETESISFIPYENTTNGIKIDYPSGWGIREPDLPPAMRKNAFTVQFVSIPESNIDKFLEKMQIITISPVENTTLDEWTLTTSEDIRESPYNHNITISRDMLGDLPARTISYMSTQGEKVQTIELLSKRYDRLYTIKVEMQPSQLDVYLPTFRKMINSFEVPFIPFSNITAGISIDYPLDWITMEGFANDNLSGFVSVLGSSYNKSFYFISPDFQEIVQILIEDLPSTRISLDNYTNATISLLREDPNPANIVESVGTEVSGRNAKRITYNYDSEGVSTRETQVITTDQDKVYTLLYSAPESIYSEDFLGNLIASLAIRR